MPSGIDSISIILSNIRNKMKDEQRKLRNTRLSDFNDCW